MKMHSLLCTAVVAASLTLPTQADNCSTLDASLSVSPEATTASVDVTGSLAGAFTVLLVGDTAGEFALDLGSLGGVTLGVVPPFAALPLGTTDAAGSLSVSFQGDGVDAGLPTATLYAQAVSLGLDFGAGGPPTLGLCESNVVTLEF